MERTGCVAPGTPSWLPPSWGTYLLGLDDDALALGESQGLRSVLLQQQGLTVAPKDLVDIARSLAAIEDLLLLPPTLPPGPLKEVPNVKARKLLQLEAFASAIDTQASTMGAFQSKERVVDVACGLGHLTRALSQRLQLPGLGLEVDPRRVQAARDFTSSPVPPRKTKRDSENKHPPASLGQEMDVDFQECDALAKGSLAAKLRPGDMVVGLHPCGSLGESIVSAIAEAKNTSIGHVASSSSSSSSSSRSLSLLMVSCCLAGRGACDVPPVRPAASATGRDLGLRLPRTALKKANLGYTGTTVGDMTSGSGGPSSSDPVSGLGAGYSNGAYAQRSRGMSNRGGSSPSSLARREARLAMRLLLEGRGVRDAPGQEMNGLPKRSKGQTSVEALFGAAISDSASAGTSGSGRIHNEMGGGQSDGIAHHALKARGLPPLLPGEAQIVAASAASALPHLRRLELLDGLVGDCVELLVNFDRACVLEEAGYHTRIGRLFSRATSPRNLAIYAW